MAWWRRTNFMEQAPVDEPTDTQIQAAIAALLARRQPGTICPSEAARALAPSAWRSLMPRVRAVAFAMAQGGGGVEIRQRGRAVDPAAPVRGPIRLAVREDGSSH